MMKCAFTEATNFGRAPGIKIFRRGRKCLAVSLLNRNSMILTPAQLRVFALLEGNETLAQLRSNAGLEPDQLLEAVEQLYANGLLSVDQRVPAEKDLAWVHWQARLVMEYEPLSKVSQLPLEHCGVLQQRGVDTLVLDFVDSAWLSDINAVQYWTELVDKQWHRPNCCQARMHLVMRCQARELPNLVRQLKPGAGLELVASSQSSIYAYFSGEAKPESVQSLLEEAQLKHISVMPAAENCLESLAWSKVFYDLGFRCWGLRFPRELNSGQVNMVQATAWARAWLEVASFVEQLSVEQCMGVCVYPLDNFANSLMYKGPVLTCDHMSCATQALEQYRHKDGRHSRVLSKATPRRCKDCPFAQLCSPTCSKLGQQDQVSEPACKFWQVLGEGLLWYQNLRKRMPESC